MLKWLVTGKEERAPTEGKEVLTINAGVTDDPFVAIGGEITDSTYNVNRYVAQG